MQSTVDLHAHELSGLGRLGGLLQALQNGVHFLIGDATILQRGKNLPGNVAEIVAADLIVLHGVGEIVKRLDDAVAVVGHVGVGKAGEDAFHVIHEKIFGGELESGRRISQGEKTQQAEEQNYAGKTGEQAFPKTAAAGEISFDLEDFDLLDELLLQLAEIILDIVRRHAQCSGKIFCVLQKQKDQPIFRQQGHGAAIGVGEYRQAKGKFEALVDAAFEL